MLVRRGRDRPGCRKLRLEVRRLPGLAGTRDLLVWRNRCEVTCTEVLIKSHHVVSFAHGRLDGFLGHRHDTCRRLNIALARIEDVLAAHRRLQAAVSRSRSGVVRDFGPVVSLVPLESVQWVLVERRPKVFA